jgi:hypothetical protein
LRQPAEFLASKHPRDERSLKLSATVREAVADAEIEISEEEVA